MTVTEFWTTIEKDVCANLEVNNIDLDLVLFGCKNELVNRVIFHGKRYINECRFKETHPKACVFLSKLDYMRKLEFHIAVKNNRLDIWNVKWDPLSHIYFNYLIISVI